MKTNRDFTDLFNKRLPQPLNVYNIFFALERQRLIQEEGSCGKAAVLQHKHDLSYYDLAGYDPISFPGLPPRFQNVKMPQGWFVPGKNSKRKHVKSHGGRSFAELARTVAANWKSADNETKDYCTTVARILKERHSVLIKVGLLYKIDPSSQAPKEEITPFLKKSKGIFCLPTMDLVSPGSQNQRMRRQVKKAKRSTLDFGDQPTKQCIAMHLPEGVSTIAHEQDTVNSHDIGRTCVMDMYQQYNLNRSTTVQDTTNMSYFYCSATVPCILEGRQNQSAGVTGINFLSGIDSASQGPKEKITRRRSDNEFCQMMNPARSLSQNEIMMNVNSGAMISNKIEGKILFGDQPIKQGMTPGHEESRFFKEHRNYSAPEYLNTSDQKLPMGMYDIQELDIADSDVVSMWLSSKAQKEG
ncbi:hypothetical protein ACHAXA_011500 [Cyclostephanos tholiformis]|uniref:HMG box domain-containing protein n=1 Tax=Cyclostephanos tholiformis TaxID=382380 RepID=A0ABD3SDU7_9STRA